MARAKQGGTTAKTSSIDPTTPHSAAILNMLSKIDRPAVFCDSGQCLPVLPGLVVDGFGDIGLPLSAQEAKRLIKLCKQAPYGKGTETLVDTNVRKVWELDPIQFTIENPKWDLMVNSVLRTVEEKLGLPGEALAAQLYKMLVYERRTQTEPKQPTDWRRASDLPCGCLDCQQLSAFLANPNLAEARFPLAKQRRQHLHGVIERAHCDCTHETLRAGRPQVLICKKTNTSYLHACQVYQQDLLHLANIRKILAKWK